MAYNSGLQSPEYFLAYPGGSDLSFRLTNLINDLINDQWTWLDCGDFAGTLWLALESQGTKPRFDWLERWDGQSVPGAFFTWPLCPSGSDSSDSGDRQTDLGNYSSIEFAYHCVVASGDLRFDASSSYLWGSYGSVWENPVGAWDIEDHWQSYAGGAWRGLAYGVVEAQYPFSSSSQLEWQIVPYLDPQGIQ